MRLPQPLVIDQEGHIYHWQPAFEEDPPFPPFLLPNDEDYDIVPNVNPSSSSNMGTCGNQHMDDDDDSSNQSSSSEA